MRKFVIGVCAWLLLSTTAAFAADVPMILFVPPDGSFSIAFPGKPTSESQDIKLADGGTSTSHMFSVEVDSVAYLLMYNDYPNIEGKPQAVLERVRDSSASGKALVTDKAISLNGVPGRAYTLADAEGTKFDVHAYIAKTRLYQFIVVVPKGAQPRYLGRMLSSFHIK